MAGIPEPLEVIPQPSGEWLVKQPSTHTEMAPGVIGTKCGRCIKTVGGMMNLVPLSSLAIGESATIRNLDAISPDMQLKLNELGIAEGRLITIASPQYSMWRINDSFIFYMEHGLKVAIRAHRAGQILVEKGKGNANNSCQS